MSDEHSVIPEALHRFHDDSKGFRGVMERRGITIAERAGEVLTRPGRLEAEKRDLLVSLLGAGV